MKMMMNSSNKEYLKKKHMNNKVKRVRKLILYLSKIYTGCFR